MKVLKQGNKGRAAAMMHTGAMYVNMHTQTHTRVHAHAHAIKFAHEQHTRTLCMVPAARSGNNALHQAPFQKHAQSGGGRVKAQKVNGETVGLAYQLFDCTEWIASAC